jgi:hypothetical protein
MRKTFKGNSPMALHVVPLAQSARLADDRQDRDTDRSRPLFPSPRRVFVGGIGRIGHDDVVLWVVLEGLIGQGAE